MQALIELGYVEGENMKEENKEELMKMGVANACI